MKALLPLSLTLVAVAAAAPSVAHAESGKHDGFFARLNIGIGYTAYETDLGNDSLTLDGAAAEIDLDVGGIVAPDFALYARFSTNIIANPTASAGGNSVEVDDTILTLRGFSVGVAYYLMPVNISFNLGAGIAVAELEFRPADGVSVTGSTDVGGYVFAGVGKEWWVAEEVALGIGAQGFFAQVPDEGDVDFSIFGFNAVFSVTYN